MGTGSRSDGEDMARLKLSETEEEEFVPELDEQSQAQLGAVLARYGDALVIQPVPDIFFSLLAKLEAKEVDE